MEVFAITVDANVYIRILVRNADGYNAERVVHRRFAAVMVNVIIKQEVVIVMLVLVVVIAVTTPDRALLLPPLQNLQFLTLHHLLPLLWSHLALLLLLLFMDVVIQLVIITVFAKMEFVTALLFITVHNVKMNTAPEIAPSTDIAILKMENANAIIHIMVVIVVQYYIIAVVNMEHAINSPENARVTQDGREQVVM